MINKSEVVDVHVSDIMLWVGVVVVIAIMAWWVLGDSPTAEIIGLTLSFAGVLFGWRAGEDIKIIKQNTFKISESVERTIELQNKALGKLEK